MTIRHNIKPRPVVAVCGRLAEKTMLPKRSFRFFRAPQASRGKNHSRKQRPENEKHHVPERSINPSPRIFPSFFPLAISAAGEKKTEFGKKLSRGISHAVSHPSQLATILSPD
jgi:hypothetical protein